MADEQLIVFRELNGRFQEAGVLSAGDTLGFQYSDDYLLSGNAQAVSHVLPLKSGSQDPKAVASFFDGLLPEEGMRKSMTAAFHAESSDVHALLSRLNNESAGALVLKTPGEDPGADRHYIPLEPGDLEHFATSPKSFAPKAAIRSRLSIAGGQVKAGLFLDAATNTWNYPMGAAPSSHILKACDGEYPHQTINEAICLKTAEAMGFDVARCTLIAIDEHDPLLAIERFDRVSAGTDFLHRIHQEDFYQCSPGCNQKYEPTGGHYANRCAATIESTSSNPYGDRAMFFDRLLFDWAIGNADNHLKNHSMLWDQSWSHCTLSPLYDITCTTLYPGLDYEMGVSFGKSRRIDCVGTADVLATAKECGIGGSQASRMLAETLDSFPTALDTAIQEVCALGFDQADEIGQLIKASFLERRKRMA